MSEPIVLDVRVRQYGGAYIARCNGCTCSCTSHARPAVIGAAKKHAAKIPVNPTWLLDVDAITDGIWKATFHEAATPPKQEAA